MSSINADSKSDALDCSVHCLYITYDGLLDPLGKTQILPYLTGLARAGYRFTILSFEKTDRDPARIQALKYDLEVQGISWVYLPFKRGRFQGVLRMLHGSRAVRRISRHDPFALAHMRTIVPAVIYAFSLPNKPFIYDIRAFSGQWVDGGRLSNTSFAYLFLATLERLLIRWAAGLVVLDQSGADHLRAMYKPRQPLRVIPTSTDLTAYPEVHSIKPIRHDEPLRFVFLGGARFPYLPYEGLMFVKRLVGLGYECQIDFINERDHDQVRQAAQRASFPVERLALFSLTAHEVHQQLGNYDCGLVFIADGPWIRMSSPTKIGEYLAAGLHVVGLSGIAALDRLAAESTCVDVLERSSSGCGLLSADQAVDLVTRLRAPQRPVAARHLAQKYYDLNQAVNQYVDLYQQVLS